MEDIAIKDFEKFCQKNDVKPTNMKADYYLAGYYKGQERMIDKACEWFSEHITDYVCYNEMEGWDIRHNEMHEDFRKAMEGEE